MIASSAVSVPMEAEGFPVIDGPTVYFLIKNSKCVYVGSSVELNRRVAAHLRHARWHPEWSFDEVQFITVHRVDMFLTERHWIETLRPPLNTKYVAPGRKADFRGLCCHLPDDYVAAVAALAGYNRRTNSAEVGVAVEDRILEHESLLKKLGVWTATMDKLKKERQIRDDA